MNKFVAITGTGLISPLAISVPKLWDNWINGQTGITQLSESWSKQLKTKLIAQASNFSLEMDEHLIRKIDRCSQFSIDSTHQAWSQAGLNNYKTDRVGVAISTGMGGLGSLQRGINELSKTNRTRINPNTLPMVIPNAPASQVSIWLGATGEIASPTSACAGGAEAIALAAQWIADGNVDIAVAGGTEAIINELGVCAFESIGALSDSISNQPQPFGKKRNGFVLGEGAGIVVLENADYALNRGANILGWISGWGSNADGYHMTASKPNGESAKLAMQKALKSANIEPNKICLIKAHATGTIGGDLAEARALNCIWGKQEIKPIVIAPKSSIGHTIGASGAIELIMALLCLRNKFAPGQCHPYTIDTELELPLAVESVALSGESALCNSFGFGGKNQSIVISV